MRYEKENPYPFDYLEEGEMRAFLKRSAVGMIALSSAGSFHRA